MKHLTGTKRSNTRSDQLVATSADCRNWVRSLKSHSLGSPPTQGALIHPVTRKTDELPAQFSAGSFRRVGEFSHPEPPLLSRFGFVPSFPRSANRICSTWVRSVKSDLCAGFAPLRLCVIGFVPSFPRSSYQNRSTCVRSVKSDSLRRLCAFAPLRDWVRSVISTVLRTKTAQLAFVPSNPIFAPALRLCAFA